MVHIVGVEPTDLFNLLLEFNTGERKIVDIERYLRDRFAQSAKIQTSSVWSPLTTSWARLSGPTAPIWTRMSCMARTCRLGWKPSLCSLFESIYCNGV